MQTSEDANHRVLEKLSQSHINPLVKVSEPHPDNSKIERPHTVKQKNARKVISISNPNTAKTHPELALTEYELDIT